MSCGCRADVVRDWRPIIAPKTQIFRSGSRDETSQQVPVGTTMRPGSGLKVAEEEEVVVDHLVVHSGGGGQY